LLAIINAAPFVMAHDHVRDTGLAKNLVASLGQVPDVGVEEAVVPLHRGLPTPLVSVHHPRLTASLE
jgi:hypothetical protein